METINTAGTILINGNPMIRPRKRSYFFVCMAHKYIIIMVFYSTTILYKTVIHKHIKVQVCIFSSQGQPLASF